MELKLDKTIKILLGAIALGLFLNASDVFKDKAYASDCATKKDVMDINKHSTEYLAKNHKWIVENIEYAQSKIIEHQMLIIQRLNFIPIN